MDEPFAALDAQTRYILQQELINIWQTLKKTVVFITHNLEEAVILADRVVVLSPQPGRIRDVIPVDLPRPRSITDPAYVSLLKMVYDLMADALSRPSDYQYRELAKILGRE